VSTGRRGHGEGSVFRIASRDRWCAEVDYGYVNGRRKRVRRSFKTRKEAAAFLSAAIRSKQEGSPTPDGRTCLADYMASWLSEVIEPSQRAESTKVSYRAAVQLHLSPALGHHRLIDVRHQHVQAFINDRRAAGCGKSLMNTLLVVLRMVLKQAIIEERLLRNVATNVPVPEPLRRRQPPRRLSQSERLQLMATAQGDRLYALYYSLTIFGLRRGEALGLREEDIDFGASALHVRQQVTRVAGTGLIVSPPKRGKSRSLYLSERSAALLADRLRERQRERTRAGSEWVETGLIFCTERGTALDPSGLNHHMAALCRRAGIPHAAPHSLRRGFADIAHALGVRDKDLQAALGHGQLSQTMDVYVATRPGTDADFSALLDASLSELQDVSADSLPDTVDT